MEDKKIDELLSKMNELIQEAHNNNLVFYFELYDTLAYLLWSDAPGFCVGMEKME